MVGTMEYMVFFRVYVRIIAEARISHFDRFLVTISLCQLTEKCPHCNYQPIDSLVGDQNDSFNQNPGDNMQWGGGWFTLDVRATAFWIDYFSRM